MTIGKGMRGVSAQKPIGLSFPVQAWIGDNGIRIRAGDIPDMGLNANGRRRLHWPEERQRTDEEKARWYRSLADAATRLGLADPEIPYQAVALTLTVTFPERRQRDYDNLAVALKPLVDVLCCPDRLNDASWRLGLIQDDSATCIRRYELRILHEAGVRATEIQIQNIRLAR